MNEINAQKLKELNDRGVIGEEGMPVWLKASK